MSAALIVNPRSGKGNTKGLQLAARLRASPKVRVHVLEAFADLRAALADCAGRDVRNIFISSGDGTIQAIQTILAEERLYALLPRLCLLPHGTTNMTAADLGFTRKSLDAQAAFIANPAPLEVRERPTLRCVNPRDGQVRHGMFLGCGAVWQATKLTQDSVHRTGLKGNSLAPLATLSRAAAKALFSKADPDDLTRIDRPHAMRVAADGAPLIDGLKLMMVASTLKKLVIGTRPFWGGGEGPLRVSVFPYPLPSILRWILPLMYGGEQRRVPQGAVSFSCGSFSISTPSPFVIDGEFFDGPEAGALEVETGPMFSYIRK